MRIVLEWLGLTDPPPGRREPMTLPAWAPLVPLLAITVATAMVHLVSLAARALFS